jgi:toxin HigB-1
VGRLSAKNTSIRSLSLLSCLQNFQKLLYRMTISSFKDKEAEKLFRWKKSHKFGIIEKRVLLRLELLDAVPSLNELRKIPGLNLHQLKGDRQGQHAIDVSGRFRVCFVWGKDNNAYEVEITDYH